MDALAVNSNPFFLPPPGSEGDDLLMRELALEDSDEPDGLNLMKASSFLADWNTLSEFEPPGAKPEHDAAARADGSSSRASPTQPFAATTSSRPTSRATTDPSADNEGDESNLLDSPGGLDGRAAKRPKPGGTSSDAPVTRQSRAVAANTTQEGTSAVEIAVSEAKAAADRVLAAELDEARMATASDESAAGPDKRKHWNRLNARKSRVRKKFMIQALVRQFERLRGETQAMRELIQSAGATEEYKAWAAKHAPEFAKPTTLSLHSADVFAEDAGVTLPDACMGIVAEAKAAANTQRPLMAPGSSSAAASSSSSSAPSSTSTPAGAPTALSAPDYALMQAVGIAKPHFLVTDPLVPDNPIVFASKGFFELTGYTPERVLGNNCRFLQGPQTDPEAITEVRHAVASGSDCHVVLLNYRADGTPFWNDLFIAPLRDPSGKVIYFVGIQSNVSEARAKQLIQLKKQAPTSASESTGPASSQPKQSGVSSDEPSLTTSSSSSSSSSSSASSKA